MHFPLSSQLARVVPLGTVGSTFDAVDPGAAHLTTWVSLDQRSGRGRLGREWVAPAGKCLAACVLIQTSELQDSSASAVGWLPLAAGLAISRAVSPLVTEQPAVKWPNDLLIEGRKVAGVLCERLGSAVVVGFGVNLTLETGELPVATATSLQLAGATGSAPELADRVLAGTLSELGELLPLLGAEELRAAVAANLDTIGRDVRAVLPSGDLSGRAVGLAPDGALQVESEGEITDVRAGDVVHLR